MSERGFLPFAASSRRPAPAPLRWRRSTVGGRVRCYAEGGEGPPVVFFHGWGVSSRAYDRTLATIAAMGTRVVAPALPGFGGSEPLAGPTTWETLADWVVDVLDDVGVEASAAFVGHSFGAGVATVTARHHPGRAGAVILVNPVGGSLWKGGRTLAERPLWEWCLKLSGDWATGGQLRAFPGVLREFTRNGIRHPANLLRTGRLAAGADLRRDVAELVAGGTPVAVVCGDRDRVLPGDSFTALCDAAGVGLDAVNGGHSWLLADPDAFARALADRLPPSD